VVGVELKREGGVDSIVHQDLGAVGVGGMEAVGHLGKSVDQAMKDAVTTAIRTQVSPRYVPDEIIEAPTVLDWYTAQAEAFRKEQ
jgi:hypothetical protein